MHIIDSFINHYIREIDYYERAARICAEICEHELNEAGIRAIVTFRVKKIDRLKEKLIKRNAKKNYQSIEEIYQDIVDLAGVRIALYFPSDQEQIDRFIKSQFKVHQIKRFPNAKDVKDNSNKSKQKYQKLFSGYHATHYRVNLKQGNRVEEKYTQANIEIQVASVLMHAWSEVEHDLIYKPLNGGLSLAEYEILDELNGLILAGELALKRLHSAVKDRVTHKQAEFTNHFELAAFIYERITSMYPDHNMEDVVMGRADLMYKFLKAAGHNHPNWVDHYLTDIRLDHGNSSVIEQMIDKMLEEDVTLYKTFLKVKGEVNRNPYSNSDEEGISTLNRKPLFYFVDKLADFQLVVKKYVEKEFPDQEGMPLLTNEHLEKLLESHHIAGLLENIRQINNDLIYSAGIPTDDALIQTGHHINGIIKELLEHFDPQEREELLKKIHEVEFVFEDEEALEGSL